MGKAEGVKAKVVELRKAIEEFLKRNPGWDEIDEICDDELYRLAMKMAEMRERLF